MLFIRAGLMPDFSLAVLWLTGASSVNWPLGGFLEDGDYVKEWLIIVEPCLGLGGISLPGKLNSSF